MGTHLDNLVSAATTENYFLDLLVKNNERLVEELGTVNKIFDSLNVSGRRMQKGFSQRS